MNILGIYNGHNATACLMEDGEIVVAISQEKFDNVKNSSGFPVDAVKYCINFAKKKNLKIDAVGVVGKYGIMPFQDGITKSSFLKEFIKKIAFRFNTNSLLNRFIYFIRENSLRKSSKNTKKYILEQLEKIDKGLSANVHFLDHHMTHAYSAYFGLVKDLKEDALVLTLDGYGDFLCSTVSVVKDGEFQKIAETNWRNSLGDIYTWTTKFLGMKMMEHEYKVMGLAPYAKEYFKQTYEKIFKGVLYLDPKNKLTFKSKFPTQFFYQYLSKNALGERFDNMAGALQYMTEELMKDWVNEAIKITGIDNIYCGGGVFMNVKANMAIAELNSVRKINFLPSAGDESTPFGAVYFLYKKLTGKDPKPLGNVYLGMDFTNKEVETFLNNEKYKKYKIEFFEDIEKEVAKLLSSFSVVARFAGKAEWGARSLGNRAILANPSDMKSFYEVNDQIKCRDFWMPFAPSVLDVDSDLYIKNPKKIEAPYMILAFHSSSLGQEKLRAAMHQGDLTLRPQILTEEFNSKYYKMIKYFKELTGIGSVMNTSLNLHGYPMVATLEQALFTFENSGLKYMALENYLISKKDE
jgi:carbamoyltransferase